MWTWLVGWDMVKRFKTLTLMFISQADEAPMEYVLRWGHNELEGVFAHGAHNHPATKTFAHRNPKLNEWKKHELNFETLQVL